MTAADDDTQNGHSRGQGRVERSQSEGESWGLEQDSGTEKGTVEWEGLLAVGDEAERGHLGETR